MAELRKGRQTPTQSVVLPYTQTFGQDAIDLYNSTGNEAYDWQKLLLMDILATNQDGLFVHSRFAIVVPRRNGKNEVIAMREMWGLVNDQKILHTAHRATTSHSAWERLKDLLDDAGIEYKSTAASGNETIRIVGGKGRINFRTRTDSGGLGEGYDLMIIDEAQEYTDNQDSSFKYLVSASLNPQIILTGTPPTAVSAGTVFAKLREMLFRRELQDTGWAEWSVEHQHDPYDSEWWYETNPSLGYRLTERAIKAEITGDDLDFNIQRLGYWVRYNLKSEISEAEWLELKCDKLPSLKGKLFVGIKFSKQLPNAAVSIAVKTQDDRIFVEGIDDRPVKAGLDWIVAFIHSTNPRKVIVDGDSGKQLLANAMHDAGIKAPTFPAVKDIIEANGAFVQALSQKRLVHMAQPSMVDSVCNVEKRAIGSNGGYGFRSINDSIDVALLDSVILAQWACGSAKDEGTRQKIHC